jgi:hypothetical protein
VNWTEIARSSWAIRIWHAAIPQRLVRAHERLASALPLLFRDVQTGAPIDDGPAIRVAEDSVGVRAVVGAVSWLGVAARHSQSARLASAVIEGRRRLKTAQSIRAAALGLFTAVVVHLVMTRFDAPEPTTMVRAAWLAILGLLVVVMAGSARLAAAWTDWSTRRRRNGDKHE